MSTKTAISKTVRAKSWYKRIAEARGKSWHKNMLEGRRQAILNPSNIRLARLQLDIHQSKIAERLEMSESTFGAIERGKRPVKADVAQKISEILKKPMPKLFSSLKGKKYVAVIQKSSI